ncbi:uncharacterized protein LOC144035231 isoform X2 [Vanacampus margaritifer]
MHGSLLVLLLLACSCQAFNYTGTAIIYDPLMSSNTTTIVRYKLGFQECGNLTVLECRQQSCTVNVVSVERVDENSGEWCQVEVIVHVNNTDSEPDNFSVRLDGIQWIDVNNNVTDVLAVARLEPRIRSDTRRPNLSPRTTMLPVFRVPSNCDLAYVNLPAFDPDGDKVECVPEFPDNNPFFVQIGTDCSVRFSSSEVTEGTYAIQLRIEDHIRKDLNLIDNRGSREFLKQDDIIGYVSVQFVLKVIPPVETCSLGVFLPKYMYPTPEDRAHLYAFVNRTLEITIRAHAQESTLTQVLFSGPAGIKKTTLGGGQFLLEWTPNQQDSGQRHALCFVVQATLNTDVELHSPMRCVILVVDHSLFGLDVTFLSRSFHPLDQIQNVALPRLKKELVSRGLPPDIVLRTVSYSKTVIEHVREDSTEGSTEGVTENDQQTS